MEFNGRSGVIAGVGAAIALVLVACSNDDETGTRSAPNTGVTPDGSAGGAKGSGGRAGNANGGSTSTGGARAPGGTVSAGGRDGTDGGIRDASIGLDAGGRASAGGNAGALTDSGRRDASGELDVDAGPTPPPYCVAPCVWEIVKHCVPVLRSCVTEHLVPSATRTCDPTTGWTELSGMVSVRSSAVEVSRYGAKCFGWASNYITFVATFTDGDGNTVAVQPSGGPVYCDITYAEYVDYSRNHPIDGGFALSDGRVTPAYRMDPTRPECAAWDSTGLPVRPPCATSEAGTCQ